MTNDQTSSSSSVILRPQRRSVVFGARKTREAHQRVCSASPSRRDEVHCGFVSRNLHKHVISSIVPRNERAYSQRPRKIRRACLFWSLGIGHWSFPRTVLRLDILHERRRYRHLRRRQKLQFADRPAFLFRTGRLRDPDELCLQRCKRDLRVRAGAPAGRHRFAPRISIWRNLYLVLSRVIRYVAAVERDARNRRLLRQLDLVPHPGMLLHAREVYRVSPLSIQRGRGGLGSLRRHSPSTVDGFAGAAERPPSGRPTSTEAAGPSSARAPTPPPAG